MSADGDDSHPSQDSSPVVEPALELTDKEIERRLGRSRGKLELAALREGVYKREGGRWYLLDNGE